MLALLLSTLRLLALLINLNGLKLRRNIAENKLGTHLFTQMASAAWGLFLLFL